MRNSEVRFSVVARPPVRRSGFPLAALAALLLLGRLPARAERDGGRILSPATGEALVAGQLVDIVWSTLPDDVEEMEFLLSIDGGRYFPLRVTQQLDPLTGSFGWVVPRVAARSARLRIRFGRDGEEIEGEPGAPFSIFLPPALRPAPFLRRHGEWWISEDRCSGPAAPGVSEAGTVHSSSRSDPAAILPPSGQHVQTKLLGRLAAAAGRPTIDTEGAFGSPLEAASPGTTPRRE